MADDGVRNYYGLRRLTVTAEQALERPWRDGQRNLDLVIVADPPRQRWPSLQALGFRIKPNWVNWGQLAHTREADFLAGLPKGERYNIREAFRYVLAQGLAIDVASTVTTDAFAEFLTLYDEQLTSMRYAVPAAHAVPATPTALAGFFSVSVHSREGLIACVMCKVSERHDAVRVAFSAARPTARRAMLTRALYMAAFAEARRRGLTWISLGTDPTLYGHIATAGLFTFKSRLGFIPVPLHHLDPDDDGADEAELVLKTDRLSHPAMTMYYAEPPDRVSTWADPLAFCLEMLTSTECVDLRPYRARFLARVGTRDVRRAVQHEGSR